MLERIALFVVVFGAFGPVQAQVLGISPTVGNIADTLVLTIMGAAGTDITSAKLEQGDLVLDPVGEIEGDTALYLFDVPPDYPTGTWSLVVNNQPTAFTIELVPAPLVPSMEWVGVVQRFALDEAWAYLPVLHHIRGMDTDAAGNIYVCGDFDVDITIGSFQATAANVGNAFVAKLDPQGNVLWAHTLSGQGPSADAFHTIMVVGDTAVYTAGYISTTQPLYDGAPIPVQFRGRSGVGLQANSALFRFDPNGTIEWVAWQAHSGDCWINDMVLLPGNEVVLTGGMAAPCHPCDNRLYNAGFTDSIAVPSVEQGVIAPFMMAYDLAGNALWGRRWSNAGSAAGRAGKQLRVLDGDAVMLTSPGVGISSPTVPATCEEPATNKSAMLVRVDAAGNDLWCTIVSADHYSTAMEKSDVGDIRLLHDHLEPHVVDPFDLQVLAHHGRYDANGVLIDERPWIMLPQLQPAWRSCALPDGGSVVAMAYNGIELNSRVVLYRFNAQGGIISILTPEQDASDPEMLPSFPMCLHYDEVAERLFVVIKCASDLTIAGELVEADEYNPVQFIAAVDIDLANGFEETSSGDTHGLQVFPVPARDVLTILPAKNAGAIEIADLFGRVIQRMPARAATPITIATDSWPRGVYVARTTSGAVRTFILH